jgi:GWxTD domain-containing protein
LLAGLPAGQVEAILLHELAHIRRGDYLINLMQTVVEGLLFYHPAIWWISAVIRAERENCCDDLVVAASVDVHEYATALAALATNRWTMRETALAATGGNLVKRIRRLLAQPEGPRSAMAPMLSAGILIVSCGVALAAWQSPQQSAPSIVPMIPVAPSPIKAAAQAPAAPVADLVASPKPNAQPQTADWKSRSEALEQLRETLSKIEGKRGYSTLMAQDNGSALPAPYPYQKWLDEVSYIITVEERNAFRSLRTDEDRDLFIKQFWLHRDPTAPRGAAPEEYPTILRGNPENAFKKEFYRRMTYVNDRFGANRVPGWKTDRGRIYIQYGPPDEIDAHPSGGKYTRPPEEGGGETTTYPFEQWRYRFIEGIGANVILEFVDPTMSGEYRMTRDPAEKDALLYVPKAGLTFFRLLQGSPPGIVEINAERKMAVTIPIAFDASQYLITTSTVSADGKINLGSSQTLASSCKTTPAEAGCLKDNLRTMGKTPLPPGSYTFTAVVKDTSSSTQKTYVVNFTVN